MHYKPATDRYYFMCNQLQENNIKNYEFVTELDKEELTQDIISESYDKSKESQAKASLITMRGDGPLEYQELQDASISLCLKYISTFKKFLNQEHEYALFLEDDCIFKRSTTIETLIENAPEDLDVMFIGGAFDINIVKVLKMTKGYALADHPATNTTSSMIFKKTAVQKIMDFVDPFCLPIDWQLNHAFKEADLNVYHTIPYICTQLSGIQFNSTIKR